MKHLIQYTVFMFITLAMISCKISTETTTENRTAMSPQMPANNQERHERNQENAEKSGLTQYDIQKLDDFAKKKAYLDCKLKDLDEQASNALSDVAVKEIKDQIIAITDQSQALGKEIDTYLDSEAKQKYFYQISKRYSADCK